MTKRPTDIGASVRGRLLHLARERREDFQLLLTRYANERLLHRLAASPHGDRFVLKGATLFTLWTGRPHRATKDIDLLGLGDPSVDHLRTVFTDILELAVNDDGVRFEAGSLDVALIREGQEYGGVRIVVFAKIDSARVRLQVDVGYGDAVTPAPALVELPALLDFPAPRIRAYPKETVVAEKLDAMVQLGLANSRMKDFYDLVVLSRTFSFDGAVLSTAIRATFGRRRTMLPIGIPVALTPAFVDDAGKRTQWNAFLRKAALADAEDLPATALAIARFVTAPLLAASSDAPWLLAWPAGGPWSP